MLVIDDLVAGHRHRRISRLGHLSVAAGEMALLVGPSGAGKTTALLALAGLATVFEGKVTLDDVDVLALPRDGRDAWRGRHVGFVFQDIHLIAGLSTLDNLLLAPFALGQRQDRARATALLDQLGLGGKAGQMAETLSRGEAQRAAIARAMLLRPKLILADEPTASLDDDAAATAFTLLKHAAEETGAALVIATHDFRLREAVSLQARVEPAQ